MKLVSHHSGSSKLAQHSSAPFKRRKEKEKLCEKRMQPLESSKFYPGGKMLRYA